MKTILPAILRGALLSVCLSAFVYSNAHCIEVSTAKFDLGKVHEGEKFTFSTEIINDRVPVLHVGLRPSCSCVTVDKARFDVAQGGRETIVISVDTAGHSPDFLEKVFVQSNSPDNPYLSIDIKGSILAAPSPAVSVPPPAAAGTSRRTAMVIPLVLFDSAGCKSCRTLRENVIPALERTYGVVIKIREYDVAEKKNYEKLLYLEEQKKVALNEFPVLFIGDDVFAGTDAIARMLPKAVEKYVSAGTCPDITVPETVPSRPDAAASLKFFPVLIAGLVDSINPCAFATIIFFLSYLSLVLKKGRSEVLLAGMVFIAGVFLSYFLIGIGLLKGVQQLSHVAALSKLVYALVGVMAFFFAGRHLYEAFLIRKRGKVVEGDMVLKLPEAVRLRIHATIRKMTHARFIFPFVFVAAMLITALEFLCTGQVYLPTIVYLVSLPMFQATAFFYLFLYCLLFIVPLLVIFILFYFGLTTERIKRFFIQEMFYSKIIMSFFFVVMGSLMCMALFR